jgi:lipopolysaccharide export system permease protein
MEGITILEHDARQNIVKKIWAEKGEFKDGLWRFYRSITSVFETDGQMKDSPQFMEEEIMTITETPRDFLNQRQEPAFMSIAQLEEYIWKLSRSGASGVIRKFRIDLYQRYLSPFTSLMIILLSIPFAFMMRRRSGGLASLGLALVVGFLYYILNAVSIALGNAGMLPELLSASLVHILALITSIYLIFKIL